jgi:hypothetical protein
VLNLGEDIGAVIIEADVSLLGVEIEISPGGGGDDGHGHHEHTHDGRSRTHSMVRERHTIPHPRYDAVYPDLRAGQYTIWRDATTPAATVTIIGGEITTYRFSAEAGAGSAR